MTDYSAGAGVPLDAGKPLYCCFVFAVGEVVCHIANRGQRVAIIGRRLEQDERGVWHVSYQARTLPNGVVLWFFEDELRPL